MCICARYCLNIVDDLPFFPSSNVYFNKALNSTVALILNFSFIFSNLMNEPGQTTQVYQPLHSNTRSNCFFFLFNECYRYDLVEPVKHLRGIVLVLVCLKGVCACVSVCMCVNLFSLCPNHRAWTPNHTFFFKKK